MCLYRTDVQLPIYSTDGELNQAEYSSSGGAWSIWEKQDVDRLGRYASRNLSKPRAGDVE